MIIDGHVHAAGKFADPAQIEATLEHFGIDKLVLCPSLKNNTDLETPESISLPIVSPADTYFLFNRLCKFSYKYLIKEQGDGNAFVHTLREKLPERIIQFYWLDPMKINVLTELETALQNWHIQGIKLHQACETFSNDSLEMHQVADFSTEYQLPVFIHIYSKPEVSKLVDLARSHPKTNFIIAHFIGMEIIAHQAAHLPNIYCDISGGNVITPERFDLALNTFGADHIIFGSDEPFGNLKISLSRVYNLNITATEKDLILGKNLLALLQ